MTNLLEAIPENVAEAVLNWREGLAAIREEYPKADTEEKRVALLQMRHALVNLVEPTIAEDDLDKFRGAVRQEYRSYIIEECLVGTNVCVETMYAVTGREVEAGRMAPDDELRVIAENGMVAPHLTRAELEAQNAPQPEPPPKKGLFSKLFGR